jgi:hypothetical protein
VVDGDDGVGRTGPTDVTGSRPEGGTAAAWRVVVLFESGITL